MFLHLGRILDLSVPCFAGKDGDFICEPIGNDTEKGAHICENSTVFSSLPVAINWLRQAAQKNRSIQFQVIQCIGAFRECDKC